MPERRALGFGRRTDDTVQSSADGPDERPWPEGVPKLDEDAAMALLREMGMPFRGEAPVPVAY